MQGLIGGWHRDAAYVDLLLAACFALARQIFCRGRAGTTYKALIGSALKSFCPGGTSDNQNKHECQNQTDAQRAVEQWVLRREHHEMPEGSGIPVSPVHVAAPGGSG